MAMMDLVGIPAATQSLRIRRPQHRGMIPLIAGPVAARPGEDRPERQQPQ
jgi:hypothetical protein